MKRFIEITKAAARVSLELPKIVTNKLMNVKNITMVVKRQGSTKALAVYPSAYGESGTVDFLIDDDLVNAKAGWYIGTIMDCKKPVHSVRMFVPRNYFGNASVVDLKEFDEECSQPEDCNKPCQPCEVVEPECTPLVVPCKC